MTETHKASDAQIAQMIEVANKAKENSYSPYSKFRVGAALLCKDGSIWPGANVENCSYPAGTCAERSAICCANANGHRDYVSILITSDIKDDFISPCGICRQAIAEFGNIEVIMTTANGGIKKMHISELLPMVFTPADLTK